MRKILWIVVFLMAGCSTTVVDREQYLILKSFKNDTPHGEGTGKSIKIARATLPLYLNSREIVYVRDGIARAYAHSFWGDLPSDFYRLVLLDKLERSGLFTAVIEQGGVVDADLILCKAGWRNLSRLLERMAGPMRRYL
ncbi:ABC-type transport auxiliary lipoprotein family protein [Campylobacter sp.]|uniref:ABC-type transport auxiliary lipoprotein family protein n=1 Tax=Campylobacter sp. TaxID=205 RepID=UPI0026DAF580|nr:ABC-type transport auxiliary lipoprotein family protein [Campylobacter sp.]MDO4673688.1 ABC-type transport auxiliary lipoprotein family protein [Campylobacter sp.]